MDEQEDEAHHQPDDGQGVEDALEYSSQFSVLSYVVALSEAPSYEGVESKDPLPVDSSAILLGSFGDEAADCQLHGENALTRWERVAGAHGSFDCARLLALLAVVLRSG